VEKVDHKKTFGSTVKAWRKRLGISQEELAERADLHRTYVSDVERGARNLSLESIARVAGALRVNVAELFPAGPARGTGGTVEAVFLQDNARLSIARDSNGIAGQTLHVVGFGRNLESAKTAVVALESLQGEVAQVEDRQAVRLPVQGRPRVGREGRDSRQAPGQAEPAGPANPPGHLPIPGRASRAPGLDNIIRVDRANGYRIRRIRGAFNRRAARAKISRRTDNDDTLAHRIRNGIIHRLVMYRVTQRH